MKEEEFLQAIEQWKTEVATTCDRFAKDKSLDLDLDFYAFQSSVHFAPPLLIIGANPGGNISYSEKNEKMNRDGRTANDLGYDSNQFIVNPKWHSNSLCELFSGDKLLPMFEKAVISNLVYFNTDKFPNFLKRKGAREALAFCKESNLKLIKILQPKQIILMGKVAFDFLKQYSEKQQSVDILTTEDGKSAMIRQLSIEGIPTFWIHHPSMNKKFNTGDNLKLKREKLENVLF